MCMLVGLGRGILWVQVSGTSDLLEDNFGFFEPLCVERKCVKARKSEIRN